MEGLNIQEVRAGRHGLMQWSLTSHCDPKANEKGPLGLGPFQIDSPVSPGRRLRLAHITVQKAGLRARQRHPGPITQHCQSSCTQHSGPKKAAPEVTR